MQSEIQRKGNFISAPKQIGHAALAHRPLATLNIRVPQTANGMQATRRSINMQAHRVALRPVHIADPTAATNASYGTLRSANTLRGGKQTLGQTLTMYVYVQKPLVATKRTLALSALKQTRELLALRTHASVGEAKRMGHGTTRFDKTHMRFLENARALFENAYAFLGKRMRKCTCWLQT